MLHLPEKKNESVIHVRRCVSTAAGEDLLMLPAANKERYKLGQRSVGVLHRAASVGGANNFTSTVFLGVGEPVLHIARRALIWLNPCKGNVRTASLG